MMAPIFSRISDLLINYLLITILAISCKSLRRSLLDILTAKKHLLSDWLSEVYSTGQASRFGAFFSSILTVGGVFGLSRYIRRTSNKLLIVVSLPETFKNKAKQKLKNQH